MEEWKDGTDGLDEYVDAWVGVVSHDVKRAEAYRASQEVKKWEG